MAKKNYEILVNELPKLIGGIENMDFCTHCMTRLRMHFKDNTKIAELEEFKKLDGVVGAQWSGEQLQVIIGQSVGDVYTLLCDKYGLNQEKAVDENPDPNMLKKKFSYKNILDYISGSIVPLIPAMLGCGFLSVINTLGQMMGVLDASVGTGFIISFASQAAIYFFPILVGAMAAKKLNGNMAMGMTIGAVLVMPEFSAAVSEIQAGTGQALSIFGIPIYATTYTNSVFPVLLAVAIMVPLEKFIGRHVPELLRVVLEPFFTLLVMLPITFCVVGPLGAFTGNYLSAAVIWLYEKVHFIGVAIFSALYPWLVMTGMHSAFAPYIINQMVTTGREYFFMTAATISCVSQGFACIGVMLRSKNQSLRSTAGGSAFTAILSGIIEPAMYGVNLRIRKPMYCAMAGSAIGSALAAIGKAHICVMGGGGTGLILLPNYIGDGLGNVLWMISGIAVGGIVTLILTMCTYRAEDDHA